MRSKIRAWMLVVWAAVVSGAVLPPPARAQDDTFRAAVHLLQESMTVRRDGAHNALLRALRHLNDPTLTPMFIALADAEHPALRIHGILGLAEVSEPRGLDLARVASIDATAVQAELLSAALDGDLVSDADARTLMGWADLDAGVKLLIASRMIEAGTFHRRYQPVLEEAAKADNLARATLASLLLMETGDATAMAALNSLNASSDPARTRVQVMLLETAMRHKLASIAPWALTIATDPDQDRQIATLALRVAMRFNDRRAIDLWRQRFIDEQDLAERIRYALIGLHLSPWLDAPVFDPLVGSEDPFIRQIGTTAAAIAAGQPNVEEHVIALLQTYHPLASRWALSYAREVASPEHAHPILLGLILIYEHGPQRGSEQRLADAVEAARVLHDHSPEAARRLLRPILASPQSDRRLTQAILLGLVRAKDAQAGLVLEGLSDFPDPTTNQIALLLRLRSGLPMTDLQTRDLTVLVRGGGQVQDPLRVQAAWQFLSRTGQADQALQQALVVLRR